MDHNRLGFDLNRDGEVDNFETMMWIAMNEGKKVDDDDDELDELVYEACKDDYEKGDFTDIDDIDDMGGFGFDEDF